jgi:hypothetical protein
MSYKTLLDRASSGEIVIYMSLVNLLEVSYNFTRECGTGLMTSTASRLRITRDHENAPVLRFALPLADKVDA